MKRIVIIIGCLVMMTGLTFGQASFSLTDPTGDPVSGTYNSTSTFTLAVNGTANGFNANGFDLFLEVQTLNGFNTNITITGETLFQFTFPVQGGFPKVFTSTSGADPGYLSDQRGTLAGDLGAVTSEPSEEYTGTAHLADITFALNNAAAGIYLLKTTSLTPKFCGMSDDQFAFHIAPQVTYTITVVPEPATWSLLGFGGLGALAMTTLRVRRR